MLESKTTHSSQGALLPVPVIVVMAAVALLAPAIQAANSPASKAPEPTNAAPVSLFHQPSTLNEGRDPFFPNSSRVMASLRPVDKKAAGPATLELKGISGTSEQPLAIINNRTLAVGEKEYINTAEGRVYVECLAIEGTKVKVSVQGETRELLLRKGI